MKKVTIYMKSGCVLKIKCKTFEFTFDNKSNKRRLKIDGAKRIKELMVDLSEIEAYIIK